MKQKIFKTEKDFKKINHLPFNREYSVRQDLIKSMNQSGFIVPIILLNTDLVDGQEKLWILDGQHRCITAQFLNIPVIGEIIEPNNINSVEDIVQLVSSLNSNSKRWNLKNYAEAYNFLGFPDYRELLKVTHSCPYSVSTVGDLLNGHANSKGGASKYIQNGTFKIVDKIGTVEAIRYAAELSSFERVSARMLVALKRTMGLKTFDKALFTKKYKENLNIIRDLKLEDYTNIFQSWVS